MTVSTTMEAAVAAADLSVLRCVHLAARGGSSDRGTVCRLLGLLYGLGKDEAAQAVDDAVAHGLVCAHGG